jgi:outer membrane lipoprotein-sorting protein
MTKTTLGLVVALTLILPLALPVVAGAMDADELIAKYHEAIGGLDKIRAVQSMKATGKVMTFGMELPFTVVQKRPNYMRIDSSMQGSAFVQAFDGEHGWSVNPMTGSQDAQDMPEIAEKVFSHEADMDGPLVDYEKKGYKVKYVGEDEVEGTPVYHLKLTVDDELKYDMYFDTEHFLLLKQARTMRVDEQEHTEETYFSDFQEVDGLIYPFAIEQRQGGQAGTQIMTETIELNVDVDDSIFVKPAKAEAKQGG